MSQFSRLPAFIVLLLLVLSPCSFAQKQGKELLDSMLNRLRDTKDDTNKVKLLNKITGVYQNIDPDEGIRYGEQGIALAKELKWDKRSGSLNNNIGSNYFVKSNLPKALEHYYAALKINEEHGDKKEMAGNLGNIGSIYHAQHNYARAAEYYLKAYKLYEQTGNQLGMALSIENIGSTCFSQMNLDCALENYQKAYKIQQALGNMEQLSTILGNLGAVYASQGKYSKALASAFESLKIDEEQGNKNGIARNLGGAGEAYLAAAMDTTGKITGDSLISKDKRKNLAQSIVYLNKAIAVCKEIGLLDAELAFSEKLSDAYFATGNYKEALKVFRQSVAAKDSIFSIENNVKITNLETERAIELKNKQIEIDKLAVAKKRNERVFFMAGMGLMLLISIVIYRNYKVQKTTNSLLSKEKKKSEDLLLNILPAEVADELKEKGTAEAMHFNNVTVLFTDFVNFTTAGERMSPQQLVGELHTCFKAFDEIVSKYRIEKIKTVGDAYIAVSGLPVANPAHAADIIYAAREIRDFMEQRVLQMGDASFDIRIGVHTGSLVAGIVGIKKFAYDIWGDTVNIAARMEQNSEPGKINISQTTYDLVKDNFTLTYRGEIDAKNKGKLNMYFVE